MKKCSKCSSEKELEDFSRQKDARLGRKSQCKDCDADARLSKEYGITLADYDRMCKEQEGRCAICGTDDTSAPTRHPTAPKRFRVDHNHTTGEVRGLLCNSCNLGLGSFKDNVSHLAAAITYIRKTHGSCD